MTSSNEILLCGFYQKNGSVEKVTITQMKHRMTIITPIFK